MRYSLCLFAIVLILPVMQTRAEQDSTNANRPYRIEMQDGSVILGRILSETADSL